jgi:hypothetical protein
MQKLHNNCVAFGSIERRETRTNRFVGTAVGYGQLRRFGGGHGGGALHRRCGGVCRDAIVLVLMLRCDAPSPPATSAPTPTLLPTSSPPIPSQPSAHPAPCLHA